MFQLTVDTMLLAIGNFLTSSPTGPCSLLFRALHQILTFGADLRIPHTRNEIHLLKLLLAALGRIHHMSALGVLLYKFLERILTHDAPAPRRMDTVRASNDS